MLLIGSKALQCYIADLGRVTHDWDLLMSNGEYSEFLAKNKQFLVKETAHSNIFDISSEIFEIKNESQFKPTDHVLYDNRIFTERKTPIGWVRIPRILDLYCIKKATANHIPELKHKHDLKLLEMQFPGIEEHVTDLYIKRDQEIKERIEKEGKKKYEFFHKYHIPEYILHDRLHDLYADLLDLNMATYKRITVAETDIAETLFNNLTHDQKISLMVEESLVLALERWFIPRMIEDGINIRLVDMFYNNNEAMPTYLILKHCCITGLKGEAEYIVNFARENFFEIEKKWQEAKFKIKEKNGFPSWFYEELFEIRKKYKNGEKVALI